MSSLANSAGKALGTLRRVTQNGAHIPMNVPSPPRVNVPPPPGRRKAPPAPQRSRLAPPPPNDEPEPVEAVAPVEHAEPEPEHTVFEDAVVEDPAREDAGAADAVFEQSIVAEPIAEEPIAALVEPGPVEPEPVDELVTRANWRDTMVTTGAGFRIPPPPAPIDLPPTVDESGALDRYQDVDERS